MLYSCIKYLYLAAFCITYNTPGETRLSFTARVTPSNIPKKQKELSAMPRMARVNRIASYIYNKIANINIQRFDNDQRK